MKKAINYIGATALAVGISTASNAKAENYDELFNLNNTTAQVAKEVNNTITKKSLTESVTVYGTNSKDGDGAGVKVFTDYFQGVAESGGNKNKVAGVFSTNLNNEGLGVKLGGGYLSIDNFGDNKDEITQMSVGGAIGYKSENTYAEFGGIVSNTEINGDSMNDETKTLYAELVQRWNTPIGQIDGIISGSRETSFGEDRLNTKATVDYYPTDNTLCSVEYSNNKTNIEGDYRVEAGINMTFEGEISPYLKGKYNTNENTVASCTYQNNISDTPIRSKPTFENTMFSGEIKAKTINPEGFNNKIEEIKEAKAKAEAAEAARLLAEAEAAEAARLLAEAEAAEAARLLAETPQLNSISDISIFDQGGYPTNLGKIVTGTGIQEGAEYYIVGEQVYGALTIDKNTGDLRFEGNFGEDRSFNITIEVVNPNGKKGSVSFILNIIDRSEVNPVI